MNHICIRQQTWSVSCVFWLLQFLLSLLLLRPPYSPRHNSFEMRPINNPTLASKCSSERKSQLMQQTSWLSYFKKLPLPPQPLAATTLLSAISNEARPSGSKKITTCWRLRGWLVFFCFFFKLIYFWLRWVFVAACGLSLVVASRGYSSLRCTGFSLRWLLSLWSTGF